MATILTRTVIIYLILSISLKVMGKRQIGEFEVGELISTLLISEIASIPICDPNIPILYAAIPVAFILAVEVLTAALKNKSRILKRMVEGSPVYIIYKGKLIQKALKDNRVSINEVLSEMRTQGVGDMREVNYAVLEQNGKLSLIQNKNGGQIAHTIIIDKEIEASNLKALGYNEEWLQKQLNAAKLKLSEVFLMTVDDDGEVNIIKREGI